MKESKSWIVAISHKHSGNNCEFLSLSLSLCFSVFCSFLHPYDLISCSGWGWGFHLLCLDPLSFLCSSPLSFLPVYFLALMRANPAETGLSIIYLFISHSLFHLQFRPNVIALSYHRREETFSLTDNRWHRWSFGRTWEPPFEWSKNHFQRVYRLYVFLDLVSCI